MRKIWSDQAWEDYISWQGQDKKTLHKINNLIKSIERNGYNCEGQPEPLKGELTGFYSVRIDKKTVLFLELKIILLKFRNALLIIKISN